MPARDGRRQDAAIGGSTISIVIRRQLGTVVVIVRGELDALGSELLAAAISDLVDGQGNLDVVVDLVGLAKLAPPTLEAIAAGAHASAQRGGRLRLRVATNNGALTMACSDGLLIAPDQYRESRWHVP